jgi:hypothetical protein
MRHVSLIAQASAAQCLSVSHHHGVAALMTRSGILIFSIRIAGAVVAAGCFLAGLWSVFRHPFKGFLLIGLGIILGVVFGRVPGRSGGGLTGGKDAG